MEGQLFLSLVPSLFKENTSRSVPVLRYSILQAVRRALYVKRLASMLMSICLLCLEFGSIRNFNVLMVWTNHGWYMKLRQGSPKVAMSTGTHLRSPQTTEGLEGGFDRKCDVAGPIGGNSHCDGRIRDGNEEGNQGGEGGTDGMPSSHRIHGMAVEPFDSYPFDREGEGQEDTFQQLRYDIQGGLLRYRCGYR